MQQFNLLNMIPFLPEPVHTAPELAHSRVHNACGVSMSNWCWHWAGAARTAELHLGEKNENNHDEATRLDREYPGDSVNARTAELKKELTRETKQLQRKNEDCGKPEAEREDDWVPSKRRHRSWQGLPRHPPSSRNGVAWSTRHLDSPITARVLYRKPGALQVFGLGLLSLRGLISEFVPDISLVFVIPQRMSLPRSTA